MRDDPAVVALVSGARAGDSAAGDAIVERYAPLVWGICRRHGLARADADDVGQSVWLRLVDQLAALRDPAALPGWIATTTRHECIRVLRTAHRHERLSATAEVELAVDERVPAVDHDLLAEERNAALRCAFAQLPDRCRELLSMLMDDPPVPYAEISARLRMPVGAIGPNRARCLDRLRRSPAVTALLDVHGDGATGGDRRGQPAVERR
jgi:RNA polymerase sigma factor (sigma-70 family)